MPDSGGATTPRGYELKAGYLKLSALAEYSGLGVRTLRTAIKERGLPCFRIEGGVILVKVSDFDDWMAQYRIGSEAEDIAKELFDG